MSASGCRAGLHLTLPRSKHAGAQDESHQPGRLSAVCTSKVRRKGFIRVIGQTMARIAEVPLTGLSFFIAMRTTKDVDILVRPADLPAMIAAMTAAGFHHRNTSGIDKFVEDPDGSARDAVHVLLVGTVERSGEPNPDIAPAVRTNDLQTVALETLVRMKLNAFRDKDRVHLRDMISLGMIDATWPARFPEPLRERLQRLLDDPDG